MSNPAVKRTYSARRNTSHRSSSPSNLASSSPIPEKHALSPTSSLQNMRAAKRARVSSPDSTEKLKTIASSSVIRADKKTPQKKDKAKGKEKIKALTQLHFALDTSVIRTCPKCALTYTRGAPADESLHKAHCARVQRGAEWGREEERDAPRAGVVHIAAAAKLKDGRKGRIVAVPADAGGKVGSKIAMLLETISLNLSSPPLGPDILRISKIFLFLLPSAASSSRETIVGVVVAQRIATAMALAPPDTTPPDRPPPTDTLVAVDTDAGLFCDPDPLPTPLGIPRLFVPFAFRRLGVATALLNAAATSFLRGCVLNPREGEVAFTQPTSLGRALMESWGGGKVRIYQE